MEGQGVLGLSTGKKKNIIMYYKYVLEKALETKR